MRVFQLAKTTVNSTGRSYRHIGPKTVSTRDTLAPVPKCLITVRYWHWSVRTLRHEDISALRHFGPSAETVRTIGSDTSVLGPGHFGTNAEVSSYCDRTVESCRDRELTAEALYSLWNNTYTGKSFLLLLIGVIHRPNVFCSLVTHLVSVVFVVAPA